MRVSFSIFSAHIRQFFSFSKNEDAVGTTMSDSCMADDIVLQARRLMWVDLQVSLSTCLKRPQQESWYKHRRSVSPSHTFLYFCLATFIQHSVLVSWLSG